MAIQKNYYSSSNKKQKAGTNLLFNFIKIAIAVATIILAGLFDLLKWAYNSYQTKKKNKL